MRPVALASVAMAIALAPSCGGRSEKEAHDSGGSGGTGSPDGSCVYQNLAYANGESFPAVDGCNTCTCDDGEIVCTELPCPEPPMCDSLAGAYADALDRAKRCTHGDEFNCETLVSSGLQCGCPTFVNDPMAIGEMVGLAAAWTDAGCGGGVVCGACPPGPASATCSRDGVCVEYNLR